MNVRDLIPWGRNGSAPVPSYGESQHPFLALHREMNRLFDDAFRGFGGNGALFPAEAIPKMELGETEKEMRVSVEIPGVEEKDIEVTLADGTLVIRGEKTSETRDDERQFSEIHYGRFERRIPMDWEVNPDEVKASFKNGVLTITVPKSEKARQSYKRIPIGQS